MLLWVWVTLLLLFSAISIFVSLVYGGSEDVFSTLLQGSSHAPSTIKQHLSEEGGYMGEIVWPGNCVLGHYMKQSHETVCLICDFI